MDISALKSFQFLKHLSDQQLILLVNKSEILKLKKGEQLIEAGENDEQRLVHKRQAWHYSRG